MKCAHVLGAIAGVVCAAGSAAAINFTQQFDTESSFLSAVDASLPNAPGMIGTRVTETFQSPYFSTTLAGVSPNGEPINPDGDADPDWSNSAAIASWESQWSTPADPDGNTQATVFEYLASNATGVRDRVTRDPTAPTNDTYSTILFDRPTTFFGALFDIGESGTGSLGVGSSVLISLLTEDADSSALIESSVSLQVSATATQGQNFPYLGFFADEAFVGVRLRAGTLNDQTEETFIIDNITVRGPDVPAPGAAAFALALAAAVSSRRRRT